MVDLIAQSKQDINHGENQFSESNSNFSGNFSRRTFSLHPISVLPNRSIDQRRHRISNRNRPQLRLHHHHPHHTNLREIYPDPRSEKVPHNRISDWRSREHFVRVPALRGQSHNVPDPVHLDTSVDSHR